ncbi:MAG: ABC transporter ATP-binding protein [Gemmatimonadetes bacterium]|nr:ABC transporter ATP-binding protein [Gemmatimonadota bacterium]
MSRERRSLILHFVTAYPVKTALIVVLLLLSGIAEGIGVATLFPLLELADETAVAARSDLGRWLFDSLPRGEGTRLGVLLSLVAGAIVLNGVFRWLAMRQIGYTVVHFAGDLRVRLIRSIMGAEWGFFVSQPAGAFANAMGTETYLASSAYRRACTALAFGIHVVVYGAIMLLVSWQITIAALLVGGAIALLLSGFVAMTRRAGVAQAAEYQSLSSKLVDLLQGMKALKAMGRESSFAPPLEDRVARLRGAEREQVLAAESLQSFREPILAVLLAVGFYIAVARGNLPFSTILVSVFLLHRIIGRFHAAQSEYQGMVAAEGAFRSLQERLQAAEAHTERSPGKTPPPRVGKGIVFDCVSFAYDRTPVLRELSFEVPAGRFVVIRGRSGAGKTTVVDLILGLRTPTSGQIYVDDIPLAEIDLARWRRSLGYVPQEGLLFHDTIYRNVAFLDNRADPSAVQRALQEAGAWEFVSRLPEGMDAVIGERGYRLSGGQRQRLAIARAFLNGPSLLVLDEATAGLDARTEAAIIRSLQELKGRVTIVAVSHQRQLTAAADIVYELADGVVRKVATPALAPPAGVHAGTALS